MPSSTPCIIAIPARFGSSRLPGKPLQLLGGEALIRHVARRALACDPLAVVIATDDARVAAAVYDMPVRVCMTAESHVSGSDRLAECARQCAWSDDAIIVNLQGDEPFAPVSGITAVVDALQADAAPMATLATPITSMEALFDPACVKVVCDVHQHAMYFSRAPMPWARAAMAKSRRHLPPAEVPVLRHIGMYAYRAGFLQRFTQLPPTPLEMAESLEQLRALEHGFAIAVRLAPEPFPAGI
ncbi:MAG: 3-deoxy-manno-octulosonate cytidylyltransferase, partial [Xanthomonadales bacterium]|nr:3-deoxy-manno-octulosonate cytidylyltransferase [Xanthomonadales bacterium]